MPINLGAISEIPIQGVDVVFRNYGIDESSDVIPSAVYFLPSASSQQVLIGRDAEAGPESHPFHGQPVYSNLKILFKNDLIRRKTELGGAYSYHTSTGIAQSDPRQVAQKFLEILFNSIKDLEKSSLKMARIYLGKPAYDPTDEQRFVKGIRQVFESLRFTAAPILVYEPYALFYYCRYGLGHAFVQAHKKSAAILVIDHGGGTINTCVVETTKEGNLRRARPRAPHASQHGGSFLDQILLMNQIRAQRLPAEDLLKILSDRNELKTSRKEKLLLQVEDLKIKLFGEDRSATRFTEGAFAHHGLPGIPDPWMIKLTESDVKDAFREVWRRCSGTVAATLKSSWS